MAKKSRKKKKIRPLGKITAELEPLYFEMLLDHGLQRHEVIGLFLQWAETHMLGLETYGDGSHPVFYGPKSEAPQSKK
jgi:hypothetical protein